jgi:hypothetical protein
MIQCDVCRDWFHFSCLGIDEDSIGDSDPFSCPACERSKPRVTVGFGAGTPTKGAQPATASTPITITGSGHRTRLSNSVAHSLPARFADYVPHSHVQAAATPEVKRPARKRTKQASETQSGMEVCDDDDDESRSYASSFDVSYDLMQRMVIGSPDPRARGSPAAVASAANTRRRARGFTLPNTPKAKGRASLHILPASFDISFRGHWSL